MRTILLQLIAGVWTGHIHGLNFQFYCNLTNWLDKNVNIFWFIDVKIHLFYFIVIIIYSILNLYYSSSSSSRTDHWVNQLTRTFGGFFVQCLSKLFLKEFTVLMVTTSFGRAFHVIVVILLGKSVGQLMYWIFLQYVLLRCFLFYH